MHIRRVEGGGLSENHVMSPDGIRGHSSMYQQSEKRGFPGWLQVVTLVIAAAAFTDSAYETYLEHFHRPHKLTMRLLDFSHVGPTATIAFANPGVVDVIVAGFYLKFPAKPPSSSYWAVSWREARSQDGAFPRAVRAQQPALARVEFCDPNWAGFSRLAEGPGLPELDAHLIVTVVDKQGMLREIDLARVTIMFSDGLPIGSGMNSGASMATLDDMQPGESHIARVTLSASEGE